MFTVVLAYSVPTRVNVRGCVRDWCCLCEGRVYYLFVFILEKVIHISLTVSLSAREEIPWD